MCSGTFVASVPFEPIWRAGNLARRRYVRELGNTPGHVNHWTRWGFQKFVETRFHVQQVRSPLPWTMVRAIRRLTDACVFVRVFRRCERDPRTQAIAFPFRRAETPRRAWDARRPLP